MTTNLGLELSASSYVHEQSTNHIQSLKRIRLDVMQSHPCTVQDVFRPIPRLVSCIGVTGKWRLLSHAQNAVWLAYKIMQ